MYEYLMIEVEGCGPSIDVWNSIHLPGYGSLRRISALD